MAGSGITFHEKKVNFTDGYKATASVTLPRNSNLIPNGGTTGTLTVELVYLNATRGKVVISGFGTSLEVEFANGKWKTGFQFFNNS